ncbi:MAG: Rrf2 family transcriptional regulator [Rhodobacteraceae bacterium]|nr:Rrf2 family transcriptional regulator [Paracoccaceae bacterium]
MKLSTKGRYAVVALVHLARTQDSGVVSLGEIASSQQISSAYLEQLFLKLRKAGIVEAVRGPGGGYRLVKPSEDIQITQILEAVDEPMKAVTVRSGLSGASSGTREQSLANRLWEGLSAVIYVHLHNHSLSDVVNNRMDPCPAVPALLNFVDE